jgi:hypothetical protein
MKGYLERGICSAGRFQHQVDNAVHAVEVDAEIWQLVIKTDGEHALRALANSPGIQQ